MNKVNYSKAFKILIFCILFAGNSFSNTSVNNNSKQLVVVIDPGHGGKDPGAVNKTIREKDVVLGIGLKLGKLISENYPEVKVIYTRSSDVFIPLIDRSKIANKNKADLFISIHANFCGTPSTRGTETFLLGEARTGDNLDVAMKENSVIQLEDNYKITYEGFDPNSSESYIMFTTIQGDYLKQSLSFARDIQQQFQSRINSSNRGPKQAGFLVLRMSAMPSVLVETGFISNKEEANYISSEDGQRNIALSILEAFRKFKDKNSGSMNKAHEVATIHQKPQEAEPKQEIRSENQKQAEIVSPTQIAESVKPAIETDTTENVKTTENNIYYSVQIGANTTPVEPVAANFKGLKNVRREKTDKYYRYYLGNENTLDKITSELHQIKLKFPQAFIVSFVDGKRVPVNVGSN